MSFLATVAVPCPTPNEPESHDSDQGDEEFSMESHICCKVSRTQLRVMLKHLRHPSWRPDLVIFTSNKSIVSLVNLKLSVKAWPHNLIVETVMVEATPKQSTAYVVVCLEIIAVHMSNQR